MKGVIVVVSVLVLALMGGCGIVAANPPLVPPVQYEQFCEAQKVAGTGIVDVSTSIVDKKIALEYYNTMAGDGDLELDSEHLYSQNPEKIAREIDSVNNGKKSGMNLIETTKMTYAGETPLVGGKLLNSKAFYGGIGAQVQEMFSVNEMEKDETSFFASTTPYNPLNCTPCCGNGTCQEPCPNPRCPNKKPGSCVAGDCQDNSVNLNAALPPRHDKADPCKGANCTPEELIHSLKKAGRNTALVEDLMTAQNNVYVPTHVIGIDTKTSFNGTWGTDATWHKIFYKDIKAHEMFTGTFEAEKLIKFHENPVPEKEKKPCDGVDC